MTWPDDYINKVICGDCLEIMKGIPDNSVDLVVTDPPYGLNKEYGIYDDTEENWYKMMNILIPEIKRISTMSIICTGRFKYLPFWYKEFPPDWLIAWYKGACSANSKVGFNYWEPLAVYGRNKNVNMPDYFHCRPDPFDNGHPCPKSINWGRWLISRASKENDLILDPFLGSGTTAVACKQLGRRYIGIEINPDYCKIAEQRLAQEILSLDTGGGI